MLAQSPRVPFPTRLARQLKRVTDLSSHARDDAAHDYQVVFQPLLRRLAALPGLSLSRSRLLDFGCGFTYTMSLLFQPHVREVVALDVAPTCRDHWWSALTGGGWRHPGHVAVAAADRSRVGAYYRHLETLTRQRLRHEEVDVRRYPGDRIPFPDGHFDCLISNAVLQELPLPLETFAAEMARVVRPGGWVDLEWHSFYSLHGHYLGAAESRSNPWGHLRGGPAHPALNRVRPEQVEQAFASRFDEIRVLRHDRRHRIAGLDPDFAPEGLELLTPELREELASYPEELLVTRGYILQARRRAA
ncbi:MAG: class I SAM-dependent methyltransferase [Armatimonadota bacterium]